MSSDFTLIQKLWQENSPLMLFLLHIAVQGSFWSIRSRPTKHRLLQLLDFLKRDLVFGISSVKTKIIKTSPDATKGKCIKRRSMATTVSSPLNVHTSCFSRPQLRGRNKKRKKLNSSGPSYPLAGVSQRAGVVQAVDAVMLHQVDQRAELADLLHVIFPVGRLEDLKMLHSIVGSHCRKDSHKRKNTVRNEQKGSNDGQICLPCLILILFSVLSRPVGRVSLLCWNINTDLFLWLRSWCCSLKRHRVNVSWPNNMEGSDEETLTDDCRWSSVFVLS